MISKLHPLISRQLSNCSNPSSKFNVFVTKKIPPSLVQKLELKCNLDLWDSIDPCPEEILKKGFSNKDAVLCNHQDPITKDLFRLNKPCKLKVISTTSYTHDNIDIEESKRRRVKVISTRDCYTEAVSELNIGMLLQATRNISKGSQVVKHGIWRNCQPYCLAGPSIQHSNIGIVGFGNVGLAISEKLIPFNPLNIYYCTASGPKKSANLVNAQHVDFESLLEKCDFIFTACTINKSTYHMFNEKSLSLMKNTSVLVNTSHADLINQDDLRDALVNKKIAYAALDVVRPEPIPLGCPLLHLENCFITPHIALKTDHVLNEATNKAADDMLKLLEGESVDSIVEN